MYSKTIIDELKGYGDNLGAVLEGMHGYQKDAKADHTPREVVYTDDKLTLYHYQANSQPASSNTVNVTPVLIVYALVNRPTILDLHKGHSAIAEMLKAGLDVYLVDWGYPDKTDNELNLDDYINTRLHRCVETICTTHDTESINILGVCQGGVLSLCYSSLYPERVKNLVTMVTPVDFKTENDLLSHWVQNVNIDLMVDTLGNIPGSMLSNTFLSLKPYQLQIKKYLHLIENIEKFEDSHEHIYNFMAMEDWIFDSPDQAGEAFRHFIKSCYQQNQLIKGELEIGGKRIDLSQLNMPILNIYAKQDHLVPPAASKALKTVVNKDNYEEMEVPGGHIGIFVSKKSLSHIFPVIGKWLQENN